MTRSLNELVYEIIELYRANYKVTDSLDERLVAIWIQSNRALLLRESPETIRSIDPHVIQVLPQVELELVSAINVSTLDNSNKILRTVREIPSFINSKDNTPMIVRLYGSELIGESFEPIPATMAPYVGSGKFNNKIIYAFLHDKRLYFTSKSSIHRMLKYVTIEGVFSNPIEAYEFVHGDGSYDWDLEYPISESLVTTMMDMIVKTKFNFVLYPPQDPANNAIDDLTNKPAR
jgi:hypothetical protein